MTTEYTIETFANRDEPVPLLTVSGSDDDPAPSDSPRSKRRQLKKVLARSWTKGRPQEPQDATEDPKPELGVGLQDRLFARILQQIIPSEDMDSSASVADSALADKGLVRPSFSLPLMTSNFRRFNARIGVVFVFQNRMIRLLSWRVPTHTWSFLAVYSLVCLNPYLLPILPILAVLLSIMVPSFVVRHPPPPTTLPVTSYHATGPAIAPPPSVKPVSEMSKDFFRNLRDLQNSMDDFAVGHDHIVNLVAPLTNFANESLCSAIFLFLAALAGALFLTSHLLPWRAMFLGAGWLSTALGHPSVQRMVVSVHREHVRPQERRAKSWLTAWIENDILLDASPETREVEVFELQRRSGAGEWEEWVFSPSPYEPLSPARITGSRPNGTRFFEDVQPPGGWQWSDKKWTLDLLSSDWVEERLITGVEVETEGQRWVYDLMSDDEGSEDSDISTGRRKVPAASSLATKKGSWRRRRWVRLVQQTPIRRVAVNRT
ncbi:MAG: hypothetical protein M1838_005573 [Thelocarpon superellum]|nr:MAG: hypothetical protein M1838_005573 [Thelocarpon superellum]